MAPFLGSGNYDFLAHFAGFGTQLSGRDEQLYADDCIRMFMAVSLSIGLLSTLASSFSFYWFVKMRRNFRHDLIMLLIQADLVKAVWFVIFPIVTYTRGPVASNSKFCQVSGFFFAVGIESSDVAVLLIALHSAMYIFRPKSGLYPYRWVAYGAYVVLPLLFASLAFLDGGYENVGYFCYLPNDTGWARLALSWIPRHILFAIIILTYLCIYVYVRRRIMNYERRASAAPHKQQSERRLTVASVTAQLERFRSLPTPFKPTVSHYKEKLRSVSVGNAFPSKSSENSTVTGPIAWNIPSFSAVSSSEREPPTDEHGPHSPSFTQAANFPTWSDSPTQRIHSTAASSSSSTMTADQVWKLPKVSEETTTFAPPSFTEPTRPSSCATIPAMFPHCHKLISIAADPSPSPPTITPVSPKTTYPDGAALTPHISHDPLTSHASRNRDKMRRQLRALFVYPLLYLVIWIFPLVNQAYGYANNGDARRPPWVLVCSLASLAVQGAADSAVFTAREKPWRHVGVGGAGFWGVVRRGWWVGAKGEGGKGRTREEMLVEVRIARARRRKEVLDEVGDRKTGAAGGRRHWWEIEEGEV